MPNREPSSSANAPIAIGRDGVTPLARSRSTAASEETTPSGPSYAPPSRTESRCEPISTASAVVSTRSTDGGPATDAGLHHAIRFPFPSASTERPRASHCSVNQARSSVSTEV